MKRENVFLDRFGTFLFIAAIVFVLAVSLPTLTTKPKLWTDEAKSIELARNFSHYGFLNIEIAPGRFTGFPSLLQSTGYPVTVALAAVFAIFGSGIISARLFMLVWMLTALASVFWLGRKIFTPFQAGAAALLIATFASFHDSGRTVVGEIPGFLFLLAALYFWLRTEEADAASFLWKRYIPAGIFLGLAVVTKPSVFITAALSVFIALALDKSSWKILWQKFFALCLGMLPAALIWCVFVLGNPFTFSVWRSIFSFYRNPYGSSVAENVLINLKTLPHTATLIYFALLILPAIAAAFAENDNSRRALYRFTFIYALLAFIYYLRSPGWLRYMVIADFLILFTLPAALHFSLAWFNNKFPAVRLPVFFPNAVLVLLLAVQIFRFFHGANIYYSRSDIAAADYVNSAFPGESVGTLNLMGVDALLDTEKRFPVADFTGMPLVGGNPLLLAEPPDIVVSYPDSPFFIEGGAIVKKKYMPVKNIEGINIYKREYSAL